ncbi:MAG: GNAT family N-acetyltransferase [Pseudomonadales bacterium]
MNLRDIEIVTVSTDTMAVLKNIDEAIFDEKIEPSLLEKYVHEESHIMLVAVFNKLVIGQVLGVIHKHPDKNTELYIDDLAVSENLQRKNIGSKLLDALFDIGRKRGAEEVWVATEPENTTAIKFYESLGLVKRNVVVFEGNL